MRFKRSYCLTLQGDFQLSFKVSGGSTFKWSLANYTHWVLFNLHGEFSLTRGKGKELRCVPQLYNTAHVGWLWLECAAGKKNWSPWKYKCICYFAKIAWCEILCCQIAIESCSRAHGFTLFELLWLNMPEFTFFYSTINFKTKKKDDIILNNIKRFSHCQFSREHRFKSHYYNHTAKICQRGASFFWKGERHTSSFFGSLGDVLITFSSTLSSELTFLSCRCFITLAGFFFLCMSINIKRAAGHQQQGDAVLASASEPKNLAQFIGLHKPSCWFRWRTLRDCTSVRRLVIFHPARPGSAPPNAASCRAARADYLCVAASWESLHNQTLFKDFAAVELVMASTMVRRTSVRGSSLINEVFIISCQPSLPPPSLLPFTHNTTMAQTPCFLGVFFIPPAR